MRYHEGQRVILKANEEEGWPEERGVIDGPSGRKMWVVTVDKKFREPGDDGLREIHEDGLEAEAR